MNWSHVVLLLDPIIEFLNDTVVRKWYLSVFVTESSCYKVSPKGGYR